MSRVRDWLSWGAARLGWPGLLGLALLMAGVAVCLAVVQPMGAEVMRLQDQARLLARRDTSLAPPVSVKDWREDLPSDHQAYGRLTRLFQAAEDAGLALNEGSYRTQFESAAKDQAGLGRLVINLPVSGNYPAIRGFLAQALNQDPALALENLRLTREAMGETELMAELRFALYLGGRP
jgi:hypothetical protein